MLSLRERIRKKIVDQDGQGEYLPITIISKTHSTWRKLIYCQLRQSWWVRGNDKLNYPPLLPLYPPFSQAQCHTVPPPLPSFSCKQYRGNGSWGQSILAPLCYCCFLITHFPCSHVGLSTGSVRKYPPASPWAAGGIPAQFCLYPSLQGSVLPLLQHSSLCQA